MNADQSYPLLGVAGFGARRPLRQAGGDTEDDYQRNRRIDLRFLLARTAELERLHREIEAALTRAINDERPVAGRRKRRAGSSAASEALAAVDALRGVGGRFLYLTRTLAEESESARLVRELAPRHCRHVITGRLSGTAEARVEDRQREQACWRSCPAGSDVTRHGCCGAGNSRWRPMPGMMQLAVAEAQRSRGGLRRLIQAFLRDFNSRAHA